MTAVQLFPEASVRFIGRWHVENGHAVTVSPGAFFELAFTGAYALLQFDLVGLSYPYAHLWIETDGGAAQEVPLDRFIRIHTSHSGEHYMRVIFKSAVSYCQRWYDPLDACVHLTGIRVESWSALPPPKKAIAFVGDSITEGVYTDVDQVPGWILNGDLVNQNDAAATYAWHTAALLGYDPIIQGYGSSGVTRGGLGGAPCAAEAYRFVHRHVPIAYNAPEMVVINHGENDKDDTPENFIQGYLALIHTVQELHPKAKIVLLQPFSGLFGPELTRISQEEGLPYISTEGWYRGNVHPLRAGHKAIAQRLAPLLKNILESVK